jgi:hypothetical protein
MSQNLRLARPYLLLLAIFTVGRLLLSAFHVPYERGHHIFSLVILTLLGSVFYGAFCRQWRGLNLFDVALLTGMLGLITQIVIFTATVASYELGVDTYFNNPRPLGAKEAVPFGVAVVTRFGGLVANTILAAVAGTLGWCIGPLLPKKT